jgi:hypothetical protein
MYNGNDTLYLQHLNQINIQQRRQQEHYNQQQHYNQQHHQYNQQQQHQHKRISKFKTKACVSAMPFKGYVTPNRAMHTRNGGNGGGGDNNSVPSGYNFPPQRNAPNVESNGGGVVYTADGGLRISSSPSFDMTQFDEYDDDANEPQLSPMTKSLNEVIRYKTFIRIVQRANVRLLTSTVIYPTQHGECIYGNRCNFSHPGDGIRCLFSTSPSLEYYDSEYVAMLQNVYGDNHATPFGIYV